MKRIIIIALSLLAVATALRAQEKFKVTPVDFNHVKEVTSNPRSIYFYPKLLSSFIEKRNDTTLTIEAYRNLYYGYTFTEDYSPFRTSIYSDKVEQLYYKQPHSRAECDSIEKYAELSLRDNLFDLNQMQFYIYVLKEKKKYARASVQQYRLDRLIAAIMSSGKGTKESPWVVIAPEHEYNIINFLGYLAVDHEELEGGLEFVKVTPQGDQRAIEGFFFDTRRMMQVAALKFPDEEDALP